MEDSKVEFIRVKLRDSTSLEKTLLVLKNTPINETISLIRASFKLDDKVNIVGLEEIAPRDESCVYPVSILQYCFEHMDNKSAKLVLGYGQVISDNISKYDFSLSQSPEKGTKSTLLDASPFTEEMAEATFYFLDLNGDDKVDRNEMITSLATALQCLNPDELSGVSAISMAKTITATCFSFLGLEDEELFATLSDFTAWYLSLGDKKYRELISRAIEAYHSKTISKRAPLSDSEETINPGNSFGFQKLASENLRDEIRNVKLSLGLENVRIKSIADTFKAQAILSRVSHHELDSNFHTIYVVSRSLFIKRFESLSSVTGRTFSQLSSSPSGSVGSDVSKLLLMIFNSFHPSGPQDSVPLSCIVSGMSLFFIESASLEDSLRQLFKVIADCPTNDKIFTSDRAVRDYLYQNIKLMYVLHSSLHAASQTDAESFTIFVFGRLLKSVKREYLGLWSSTEFVSACIFAIGFIFAFLDNNEEAVKGYVPHQLLHSNGVPVSADMADSLGFDVVPPAILEHEDVIVSLVDAKIVLGLATASPITVFQLFKTQSLDPEGNVTAIGYYHVLHKLFRHHYSNLSIVDRIVVDYIVERVMTLFAINSEESKHDNHEKKCDVLDVILSLITLCGGTPQEKASCIVEVFRYYGDSPSMDDEIKDLTDETPIPFEYVAMCTEPIFVTIAGLNPKLSDKDYVGDLSYELTSYAFESIFSTEESTRETGALTVEQFETWFEIIYTFFDKEFGQSVLDKALEDTQSISDDEVHFNNIKDTLTRLYNAKYSQSPTRSVDDNVLMLDMDENDKQVGDGVTLPSSTSTVVADIKYASELLGFDGFSADDILDTLGEFSEAGVISLSRWLEVVGYTMCLANISEEKYPEASEIAKALFDSLKADESFDSISITQLTSGLTVLSASPIEDRLSVSFAIHDSDSDGKITFDEFVSLVGSNLSIVLSASEISKAKVREAGVSVGDLAVAVVSECYAALGMSKSVDLTLEQVCEVGTDCLVLAENVAL